MTSATPPATRIQSQTACGEFRPARRGDGRSHRVEDALHHVEGGERQRPLHQHEREVGERPPRRGPPDEAERAAEAEGGLDALAGGGEFRHGLAPIIWGAPLVLARFRVS